MLKNVLVTGGAGFIGSHTLVELIESGYTPIVIDDLSNSSAESLRRVGQITGTEPVFYQASILDRAALDGIFEAHDIDAVIHFAGFKAVGESVEKPLEYYRNNIVGTLELVECMRDHGCKRIIFSSSATVYGDGKPPLRETDPKGACTNPYGRTKSMIEDILTDLHTADSSWDIALLRYFNPIGAHESGLIGEDPQGIPNNLLPYVSQVAVGRLEELGVFGNDYDTPDGTCIRDYIHVVDLARGHVATLDWMGKRDASGVEAFNLGTGNGVSVLQIVEAFGRACGHPVPYSIKPRRAGDLPCVYANADKAREVLGWTAQYDIDRMCADAWRWQSTNPGGYTS